MNNNEVQVKFELEFL